MTALPQAGHLKAVLPCRATGTPHDMHLDAVSIGPPETLYRLPPFEPFGSDGCCRAAGPRHAGVPCGTGRCLALEETINDVRERFHDSAGAVVDQHQRIIMAEGNALQIAEQAQRDGIASLRRSGLNKVRQGLVGLEEVNRVI